MSGVFASAQADLTVYNLRVDSHREKSEELTAGASVLVRAHLDSPYLLEALESIATQSTTFPFEILVALDRATPPPHGPN